MLKTKKQKLARNPDLGPEISLFSWHVAYMCICVYVYMCICVCICVYMCVYMCVCMCICVCMYVYIYVYYMCAYVCICELQCMDVNMNMNGDKWMNEYEWVWMDMNGDEWGWMSIWMDVWMDEWIQLYTPRGPWVQTTASRGGMITAAWTAPWIIAWKKKGEENKNRQTKTHNTHSSNVWVVLVSCFFSIPLSFSKKNINTQKNKASPF
jgi:hypothetical protein